jgi:hypothetical protein
LTTVTAWRTGGPALEEDPDTEEEVDPGATSDEDCWLAAPLDVVGMADVEEVPALLDVVGKAEVEEVSALLDVVGMADVEEVPAPLDEEAWWLDARDEERTGPDDETPPSGETLDGPTTPELPPRDDEPSVVDDPASSSSGMLHGGAHPHAAVTTRRARASPANLEWRLMEEPLAAVAAAVIPQLGSGGRSCER